MKKSLLTVALGLLLVPANVIGGDIATAPTLGLATSTDFMVTGDASAAAGSRMRQTKFSGASTTFLRGDGIWATPPGEENLTGVQVKNLYEAEANTNAFTDTEKADLAANSLKTSYPGPQDLTGKQDRVTGTCTGQVMVGINANGTAICEDDAVGAEGSGEENVQADWDATSGDAFILNKPTIPSNTDNQTLSISGQDLTLSDGGTVTLPVGSGELPTLTEGQIVQGAVDGTPTAVTLIPFDVTAPLTFENDVFGIDTSGLGGTSAPPSEVVVAPSAGDMTNGDWAYDTVTNTMYAQLETVMVSLSGWDAVVNDATTPTPTGEDVCEVGGLLASWHMEDVDLANEDGCSVLGDTTWVQFGTTTISDLDKSDGVYSTLNNGTVGYYILSPTQNMQLDDIKVVVDIKVTTYEQDNFFTIFQDSGNQMNLNLWGASGAVDIQGIYKSGGVAQFIQADTNIDEAAGEWYRVEWVIDTSQAGADQKLTVTKLDDSLPRVATGTPVVQGPEDDITPIPVTGVEAIRLGKTDTGIAVINADRFYMYSGAGL